jgi:hypothetical protein
LLKVTMGRIRDALTALFSSKRDPYVRWSEIPRIKLILAEQDEALASLYDKLNTAMARWRKREQRERAATEQAPPAGSSKAALRHRAAQLRFPDLATRFDLPPNGNGHDVSSDQAGESE